MTAPVIGIMNTRPDEEIVSVSGADFAKVLIIEASEDASNAAFPIGEPVRFASNDPTKLAALGTGPLADAVRGINAQLGELQTAADVTVFRIAEGASEVPQTKLEQTTANIVAALTAARDIPSEVNATPRIVVTGRTAWRPDANSANPVVAALGPLLDSYLAVSIVDAPDASLQAGADWREKHTGERIIPVSPGARVLDTATAQIVNRSMAPRVAGLGVRIDHASGGKPFNPWCNYPIRGITGLTRNIPYSLTDGATEAQQLLDADIGVVVSGEFGVDTAIADGGFIYLGTDSLGASNVWSQYHQLRALDYITVKAMRIGRQFLGRKATAQHVEAWILSLREMVRGHVNDSDILGGKVDFPLADAQAVQQVLSILSDNVSTETNSIEKFRQGDVVGVLRIEPAPVIKRITNERRRYRKAVETTLRSILLSVAAASS